jgi:hypothetical protein
MDLVVVSILAAAAGLVMGYGVRNTISRHRHAAATPGPIISDKAHTFNLIGPQDAAARKRFDRHKEAA